MFNIFSYMLVFNILMSPFLKKKEQGLFDKFFIVLINYLKNNKYL